MNVIEYSYKSVPTIWAFTQCNKRIKCLIGPVGSGKSSGCVMHLLHTAQRQEPIPGTNIRATRYVIIRNTYKELYDTTKRTIDEWITPLRPIWKEAKSQYIIEFKLTDNTKVHTEWLLRALDKPDQLKDLLSLEVSGAWINEAREVPYDVFTLLDTRIGRYPRRMDRYNFECTYPYIILDSNPPDTDNWLYKFFEELPLTDESVRDKIALFKQPSGLSPDAENLNNLPSNYYQNLIVGKDPDFIRVYIHGEYGYLKTGRPIFPLFSPSYHVAKDKIIPKRSIPLTIGMDFGLYPACVITQLLPDGALYVYDEIVSEDVSDLASIVSNKLLPLLNTDKYRGLNFIVIGDPAGSARSQLDSSKTCFTLLRSFGIKAFPAYTNALQARIQAVNTYLTKTIKGKPGFLVDPSCSVLIKALSGKYCFRRLKLSGERYSDVPDKNEYSHVADALTYACMGYIPRYTANNDDDQNFSSSPPLGGVAAGGWF